MDKTRVRTVTIICRALYRGPKYLRSTPVTDRYILVMRAINSAPSLIKSARQYFVDRIPKISSQTREDGRGCGEDRRRRCIQLNSAARPLARGRTLTPLAPACARYGIMIHNRPEFTQPRVKTHWELGVARGSECSARPENGCAVRAPSKNHEVPYTSRHTIGRAAAGPCVDAAHITGPIRSERRTPVRTTALNETLPITTP